MNDNAIQIRRSRVFNFMIDDPLASNKNPSYIASELDMEVNTVKNDLRAIDKLQEEQLNGFDLKGMMLRTLSKMRELEKSKSFYIALASDNNNDVKERIASRQAFDKSIRDIFYLENHGLANIKYKLDGKNVDKRSG